MARYPSDVAFTPSVKAEQERHGSRVAYTRMEQGIGWRTRIDAELAAFVAERNSFYIATVSSEGHPYVQHRGGPKGFLKALDETTFGFADFRGNQQFISTGNLKDNDRACIFLMDYPNRRRIKMWGRARAVENDKELLARLADTGFQAPVERAITFRLDAWDLNCKQYITPRYTLEELEARGLDGSRASCPDPMAAVVLEKLERRLADVLSDNAALQRKAADLLSDNTALRRTIADLQAQMARIHHE